MTDSVILDVDRFSVHGSLLHKRFRFSMQSQIFSIEKRKNILYQVYWFWYTFGDGNKSVPPQNLSIYTADYKEPGFQLIFLYLVHFMTMDLVHKIHLTWKKVQNSGYLILLRFCEKKSTNTLDFLLLYLNVTDKGSPE